MKHSDLQRAVAQATGESVRLIKAIGFREASVPTKPIGQRSKRRRRRRSSAAADASASAAVNQA
jgi:hypothetical protein